MKDPSIVMKDPSVYLGTRLLAMDDDLREKASECIQKNFFNVLQTREFSSLPSIKLEIIGKTNERFVDVEVKMNARAT